MDDKRISSSNQPQTILIALLVIAAFVIGSLWQRVQLLEKGGSLLGSNVKTSNTTAPAAAAPAEEAVGEVPPITKDDHIRGDRNAQIALIEYSDLECPFCKRFHPTAQQVVDTYKGKVMWVYRHFPLDQIHSKARKEAEATECAFEQAGENGFWKLADKIYEVTPSNNGLNADEIPTLAAQVGLNQASLKTCWDSEKYKAKVDAQYQGGVKAGVNGTPGNILLNVKTGKKQLIPGAVPFETLKQAIDQMLAS